MFLGTEGKSLLSGGGGGHYIRGPKNNIKLNKTFLFVLRARGMSNRDTLCTKNNTLIKKREQ